MIERCWQVSALPARNRVTLRYQGPTPTDELVASLEELRRVLPGAPVVLVVDIRELDGENPDARVLWRAFLREHRAAIAAAYVVSHRTLVLYRMVSALVSLGTGVHLHFVESSNDIP
jgi:hypothetical protein